MKVPFLDLKAQYESIRPDIQVALHHVLERTAFAGGPFVAQFEEEFANFCGCQHAIGVGSGTEAIWFALLALGIGEGDEVITVPNTFIATAEAISFCGAKPVFVDIDEKTYTMDPNKLEDTLKTRLTSNASHLKPRPKAVLPVHLFGQMADMDPILDIAKAYDLPVVEDACQAHGASYKGRRAGSLGDAGCFSFYPGKNLGAYGEGGAVTTNNGDLARKIQMLRDHGQPQKYYHNIIGWNGRMDGIQAAVLSVKLKYLEIWNEARRQKAHLYDAFLKLDHVVIPEQADYGRHIYHIYAIRIQNRDGLMKALAESGIGCGIHYPIPIHLQDAYRFLGYERGSFPTAETYAEELLSLPIFPELPEDQLEYVANGIKQFVFGKEQVKSVQG
ncbi:MAG: erythromycin biosynthesis sensory transduction protein eryC1 [Deltaproteobacteria bacterium RBG_16_50_11]|nr:MAG: erythromycin biosynthesis sensory transduction protein eryC1 [Deltaproteobacteria bacterium RBG_16_50_11]